MRVRQSGQAVRGEFRYGFSPSLSAGVLFRYLQTELEGIGRGQLPPQIGDELRVELGSLGVVAPWDSTDSTYYPTSGKRASLDLMFTETVISIPRQYSKTVAKASAYVPLGESIVVAGDFVGCSATDEAPLYDACLLGGTDAFRGYPLMRYFGNELVSAQAELRGTFGERFGYVAFAGVGQVTESLVAATDGAVAAGGVELRFRVSREFDLDLSLDPSVNEQRETLVYLYVGQRFCQPYPRTENWTGGSARASTSQVSPSSGCCDFLQCARSIRIVAKGHGNLLNDRIDAEEEKRG